MKNKSYLILLVTSLLLTSFYACKKDKNNVSPTAYGDLNFHIHSNIDSFEVEGYDTAYPNSQGRLMRLSLAQFYVSKIQLVKLDGSTVDAPKEFILKTLEDEEFELGKVPVGNYKAIRFYVGLNSELNKTDPTTATDSLLKFHPEMLLKDGDGENFVFFNLQGSIDTSKFGNGSISTMQPFDIRIGTNSHFIQVQTPDAPFQVFENQSNWVHIVADYAKIFDGWDWFKPLPIVNDKTANTSQIAIDLANKIPGIFRFE